MPVSCFLRGTRIQTAAGERCVEEIAIGDQVWSARGEYFPVKWIGRRRYRQTVAGSSWPEAILPVRVSRYALDGQTPHADLYISTAHQLYIDGVLISAIDLVNGVSIVQALPEGVRDIEYYHIELDTHEVIYAEGAAVETLLGTSDRETFSNFAEYRRLYGSEFQPAMIPFAPSSSGRGRRALVRRIASRVIDVRNPSQVAYDRIAALALDAAG